ncbi:type II toxin-antitoxin system RelE/ParE family toxin [Campylobacter concisus]|uniref:type II toxin-antitoxin system RelE/ParE family toxin n=1 Tax=Campylobacter concisus TaxID=199 RepID=UPI003D1A8645
MKILFTDDFKESLKEILKFIKQDNKDRAYNFRDSLKNEIMKIPERPYSYRENLIIKDTQVRDLVFKGYVVVFVIDEGEQTITIISIYKYNLPNLKYPQ